MQLNQLEKNNNIDLNNNLTIEREQNKFLETRLGKTINMAIDVGIRSLLPDFLDEQVINLKNNFIEYGMKEGIRKTIDDSIELGKSALGIVTGNFENIGQMQMAIKEGGIIDGVSSVLNIMVDKARKKGIIDNKISNILYKGKDIILSNVEKNIESTFNKQYETLSNADRCIFSWKKKFKNQDFKGMEKYYIQLEKQIKNLAPIEKTINDAKTIKILHNLIKNNGGNFNLTKEELELAEKLK